MNSKCKCCGCEISDEEKNKTIEEFGEKIFPIIDEYLDKMPEEVIASFLINLAKSVMCSSGGDYLTVSGTLYDMLQDDLKQMFASYNENKEEEKTECIQSHAPTADKTS